LALQFVGITLQGKFFQYHYGASIPLIGLMAGQGYYKLWRRLGPGSLSSIFAYGAFLVIAATMRLPVNDTPEGFWKRSILRTQYLLSGGRSLTREDLDERIHFVAGYNLASTRQVAHEIAQLSLPTDPIYVWGFEPALYWFSDRRPSSSYIYNVPQRSSWQSATAWQKLWSDLRENPPKLVVTQRLDVMPFVTGTRLDSTDSLPLFPEFERYLTQNYQITKTIDRFTLWSPRTPSTPDFAKSP
jgi:hypothetical protein